MRVTVVAHRPKPDRPTLRSMRAMVEGAIAEGIPLDAFVTTDSGKPSTEFLFKWEENR